MEHLVTRRFALTVLLVTLISMGSWAPAVAERKGGETHTGSSGILVEGHLADAEAGPGGNSPSAATPMSGAGPQEPLTAIVQQDCESINAGGCVTTYHCPDGAIATSYLLFDRAGTLVGSHSQCPGDPAPTASTPAQPTITPARVLGAFREVPLPSSDIIIQPEGGETLVNHPTFYRTEAAPFDETVTFFGGRVSVVLHIRPASFRWQHGDGTSATTTDPGSPYTRAMGLDYDHLVFHEYAEATKGVPASVDTTWSATWTLNGRDMGAVPGTVTIEGTPQTLDVFEARPVLVG